MISTRTARRVEERIIAHIAERAAKMNIVLSDRETELILNSVQSVTTNNKNNKILKYTSNIFDDTYENVLNTHIYTVLQQDVEKKTRILLYLGKFIYVSLSLRFPYTSSEDIRNVINGIIAKIVSDDEKFDVGVSNIETFLYRLVIHDIRENLRISEEANINDVDNLSKINSVAFNKRLFDAILSLSFRQKSVINMFLKERSFQNIALDMGLAESTVKAIANRALKRIRYHFEHAIYKTPHRIVTDNINWSDFTYDTSFDDKLFWNLFNHNGQIPQLADIHREPLSFAELQVLVGIVNGSSRESIARRHNKSIHTINEYCRSIMQKLGRSDITKAAIRAYKIGLLE